MPWLLPVVLSAQACLESSHKQDPWAIWGVRRQPGSRALLALNTPRQAHLNLQSLQTHGYNRAIIAFHHSLPQKCSPASWGQWQGHVWLPTPLPLSRAERGAQHSSVTPLILAWAFKEETPHTLNPWPKVLSPRGTTRAVALSAGRRCATRARSSGIVEHPGLARTHVCVLPP